MKKVITLSSLLCCLIATFILSSFSISAAFGGTGGGIILDSDVTVEVKYIDTDGNIIDNNLNYTTTGYNIKECMLEQKNISEYTYEGFYFEGSYASGGSLNDLLTTNPPKLTELLGDLEEAPAKELTYYAYMVYSKNPTPPVLETYTIEYHPNGGTGSVIDITEYQVGEKIIVKDAELLERESHNFSGWNTMPDGTGDHFQPGEEIEVLDQNNLTRASKYIVLYAQWQPHSKPPIDNGSDDTLPEPPKADNKPNISVTVERSSNRNISPATRDGIKYEGYVIAMGMTGVIFYYVIKKKYRF